MTEKRKWEVSYTAKRKVIYYQRQTVTLTLDARLFRIHFGRDPEATGDETMQIEQLAVEMSAPPDDSWEETAKEYEALDETDFEITETPQ